MANLDVSVDLDQVDVMIAKMKACGKSIEDAANVLKKNASDIKPIGHPMTNQVTSIWEKVAPQLQELADAFPELIAKINNLCEQERRMQALDTNNTIGNLYDSQ